MSKPREAPRHRFLNTCNLLSRYIKEKGGLGGLAADLVAVRPASAPLDPKGKAVEEEEEEPARRGVVLPDLNAATAAAAPQMTIFYAGRVVVFDDLPEERAREIIAMAGEGAAAARAPATAQSCPPPPPPPSTSGAPEHPPLSSADLPIARRVSLNRFLEKRKDRISSKAPYQVQDAHHHTAPSSPPPEKPQDGHREDPRSWLGLAPSASSSEPKKL